MANFSRHHSLRGCYVYDVTEEYTSKTCTNCGRIHQNNGGSKFFKCPECGHILPRDFNSVLGIIFKALSDTTFTNDAWKQSQPSGIRIKPRHFRER